MVREEMLDRLENDNVVVFDEKDKVEYDYFLTIISDEEGKEFQFEFHSPAEEDFIFDITAENDMEMYHELYQYAQCFDQDEHVRSVMDMKEAPKIKELVEDAEKIEKILYHIADTARDYIRGRELLMDAADCVKPGDTIVYTVSAQKYEGIAASAPEVNYDSDEHDVEIQFEDGGAVVVDESIADIKPIIANHIKDSAKDLDVNEIEDGVQVLEMYVVLDALGEYAMENLENNIQNATLDGAYVRFYQDGNAELIAEGYGEISEKSAWIYEIPQGSQEYEALCAYVQNVTGEPIQDTINRMLETIEKAVFKLEHAETLHKLIDEGEVTGLEYAGEHCEAAYIKGNRLYMEGTNASAVQDVKDMLDRNGFQYEECKKDRDWNRENS